MLFKPKCRGINVNEIIISVNNSLKDLDDIENIIDFNWKLVPKLTVDD